MAFRFRLMAVALATTVLAALAPSTALATASSTAGDATPNFTESSGCGTYGVRGPLGPTTRLGDRIYGPFAEFFGRSWSQVEASIVNWTEPSGHTFRVHTRTRPALQDVGQSIRAANTGYRVRSGASWVWRNVSGRRQMSQHAVGNALDLNPAQNPHTSGSLVTNMPSAYVAAWKGAGFCWGGDWRFFNDAMHYSWKGPAASGGMTTRLLPYAPLTASAGFTVRAFDAPVAVPSSAALFAMADRRREGADDLYALVDSGGKWQVQIAGAVSKFGTLGVRRDSLADADGIPLFADANGDGRADLWRFTASSPITAQIYTDSSRFRQVGLNVTTGASWSADAELGLAVFGWDDWLPDLYVIRRDTGQIEVYSSSSGYQTLVHTSTLPVAIGDAKVVLADRNMDGNTDLWLVRPGDGARVEIMQFGGAGFAGAPVLLDTTLNVPSGASVLPGDWDGDGRIDLYVVAGGRLSIWLGGVRDRSVASLSTWFMPDGPMTFDSGPVCVGTCDQIGYVGPGGSWRLAHQVEWAPEESNFFFGNPADTPFMGDWDCDGEDTPGLYRRSDGYVYLRNSNTQGVADVRFFFGDPSDVPLPGDFDGDGCDTVSIYRPSEQRVYVINRLGSGDGGLGPADYSFMFGNAGDKPFTGDFDGNGIDEVGLHRESTGRVYFRFSLTTGAADRDFIFGNPGDFLVAGDWNGDGIDTPAIFRPSDGNWYVRLSNTQGIADHVIPFGLSNRGYVPVTGHNALAESISGLSGPGPIGGDVDFVPLENN